MPFFPPAIRRVASCPAHAHSSACARRGAGGVQAENANGERQSKPIRRDAARLTLPVNK